MEVNKLNLSTFNWHHCLSKEIKTNLFTEKMMSIETKTLNGSSLKVKTYKNPVPYKNMNKNIALCNEMFEIIYFFLLVTF